MPQLTKRCSEIVLTFNRTACRSSVKDFQLLSGRLRAVDGVVSIVTRLDLHGSQHMTVYFREGLTPELLLRRMASALRNPVPLTAPAVLPSTSIPAASHSPQSCDRGISIEVGAESQNSESESDNRISTRITQFAFGTMAAGSFVMAWIGLVVPGIPTVPFVILTAVLAAKASPAFRRRLTQSRVLGPMIKDWNTYHAIRPQVRDRAIILTLGIVGITLLLAPESPLLYAIMGLMLVLSLSMISMLPVLDEREPIDRPLEIPRPATAVA